jgi:tetratricopeptide (TPR) repeat protein
MKDKDHLISKYFSNSLSEEERQLFEQEMAADPDFKKEVEFLLDLGKVAEFEQGEADRKMVAGFEADHHRPNIFLRRKVWLVAATLALLISLTYFSTRPADPQPQELFAVHFEAHRNIVQPLVRSSAPKDESSIAFLHYEKGEYNSAIPLFDELYAETRAPHFLFYKANALLAINESTEAIRVLQEHLQTDGELRSKSHWYLALAYLKENDVEKAKKTLEVVIEQNVFKVIEAKALLKALD